MTTSDHKGPLNPRLHLLDAISESIEEHYPGWASDLRDLRQAMEREDDVSRVEVSETVAGLRARLRLAEKAMSTIEDEHIASANLRYCDEGSCHDCQTIERINLALAGEA